MDATAIVNQMLKKDAFSKWLGINLVDLAPGYCKLSMEVRSEMLNGFEIAHGGITYSLADSALAFASNSHGKQALSIETSISHLKSVKAGEILFAEAKEMKLGKNTAIYYITVRNSELMDVALFKGTVFRTDKNWE